MRRSNLENHPGRIVEPQKRSGTKGGGVIKLSAKTGMPTAWSAPGAEASGASGTGGRGGLPVVPEGEAEEVKAAGKGAAGDEGSDGEGSASDESAGGHLAGEGGEGQGLVLQRRKGESADERRARKAAVKEARRESRATKKALKEMFKEEAGRQKRQQAGKGAAGQPQAGSTFVIA